MMIDGSEKRSRQLAFELQNSHVCEKRSNDIPQAQLFLISLFVGDVPHDLDVKS